MEDKRIINGFGEISERINSGLAISQINDETNPFHIFGSAKIVRYF